MQESKYSYQPCEAEIHEPDCDGRGVTKDHFTAKCVARILGWTHSKTNSPENLQYLSVACHVSKDRDTALRAHILERQVRGREHFTFAQHIETFLGPGYLD